MTQNPMETEITPWELKEEDYDFEAVIAAARPKAAKKKSPTPGVKSKGRRKVAAEPTDPNAAFEELLACARWEYARESKTIRNYSLLSRAIRNIDGISPDEKQFQLRRGPYAVFLERWHDFRPREDGVRVPRVRSPLQEKPWLALPARTRARYVAQMSWETSISYYTNVMWAARSCLASAHSGPNWKNEYFKPLSGSGVHLQFLKPDGSLVIHISAVARRHHGVNEILNLVSAKIREWAASMPADCENDGSGRNQIHLAYALRALGYCRLRSVQGQIVADAYQQCLPKTEGKPLDWDRARRQANEWLHRLHPIIPKDERPFHCTSQVL
jgi:hypothetical protein